MAERELFPNNSERAKEQALVPQKIERDRPEPVAHRVKVKKKETTGQKFKRLFFAEDINDIGGYLVNDLIVPSIKETFLNFMTAALMGDRRSNSGYYRGGKNGDSKTNYNKISTQGRVGFERRQKEDYSDDRKQFDIDNILFATKAEADEILSRMDDCIENYGVVTVGYLYDLLEESGPYTLEYYGWRSLRTARVVHVRNGYSLELPRPIRLER